MRQLGCIEFLLLIKFVLSTCSEWISLLKGSGECLREKRCQTEVIVFVISDKGILIIAFDSVFQLNFDSFDWILFIKHMSVFRSILPTHNN